MKILGISAFYHDSAAAIVENGFVIAAAQEERFSRKKNDASFPKQAIQYCLSELRIELHELDGIVFYDKPFLKFERLLETYISNVPKGIKSFVTAMPVWLKEKLFLKSELKKSLEKLSANIDFQKTPLLFSEHHLSHGASAFYPSGFDDAAVVTIDGVGEWATASIAHGSGEKITPIKEMHYPDSLGLLYSAFTYYLGFEVNAGEYKMMGLAPYGTIDIQYKDELKEKIKSEIVTIFEDGSIRLTASYFSYSTSLRMIKEKKWHKLFGKQRRKSTEKIEKFHYCLALAIQEIAEEVILKMVTFAKEVTKSKNLCLAGGVALNCVANGKIQESQLFDDLFIQPAAGDAGGAVGAALAAYHLHFKFPRPEVLDQTNIFNYSRLGPSFSELEIQRAIERNDLKAIKLDQESLVEMVSQYLIDDKIIGWFQGRMEFGPRALGGRSILGNPLSSKTQSQLNLKVKKRESFRPFAPIMLKEDFLHFYGKEYDSPYMLMVHKILPEFRHAFEQNKDDLIQTVNEVRSVLPSITHVDYSSRIQTVTKKSDALLFDVLTAFKKKSGAGVLVNTSFNVKDEPIVCSPEDAIHCFQNTEIDVLVLGEFLIKK
jgi:carbamoyltransferase